MPRSRTDKLKKDAKTSQIWGWVRANLDAEELKEYKAWVAAFDGATDLFSTFLDNDYVLKFYHDDKNECYVANASGHWERNPDLARWTLVGRGSTPMLALCQLYYKHVFILDATWSKGIDIDKPLTDWV